MTAVNDHQLPLATCKRIFFIRHAESQWNAAQRRRDVRTMVSQVDHPLTPRGLEQARSLRRALVAVREGPECEELKEMLEAEAVWVSPFTRTIQTALVALQPLLEGSDTSVSLKPVARERKKASVICSASIAPAHHPRDRRAGRGLDPLPRGGLVQSAHTAYV